ncbi:MAG: ABC transporter permease [Candidatus Limiplasma sp.]|nr:ABC transporter permease [Clostridiales bacterium]MDY3815407.1 ABC transporter permease [Candidatus Limiplasma sp.]
MKRFDFWKWSLRSVLAAPLRSLLTVMGIAVGIGAILSVLTLGSAGKNQVRTELKRLGIDQVWMTAAQGGSLRQGDGALISETLHVQATEQVYVPAEIRCGGASAKATVVGCTQSYLRGLDVEIVQGRGLYPLEWKQGGRSLLMGQSLARELSAQVDGTVSLGGGVYWLRGIVGQPEAMSQIDMEYAVLLPLSELEPLTGQTVHEITVQVPDWQMPQSLAAMAQRLMSQRRGVETETLTMQVQLEAADGVIAIFVDVLKWVAFICTLVGGIGVMNILLVSVRERRREIGVMKALGTTQPQVCLMFLQEALLYAASGGALGLLTGLGLIRLAGRSIGLHPVVNPGDCAVVAAAALAVGLFFGAVPALRAGRMKPADALRDA